MRPVYITTGGKRRLNPVHIGNDPDVCKTANTTANTTVNKSGGISSVIKKMVDYALSIIWE